MGRAPCCAEENGMKKGPWTPEEDEKLSEYISKNGHGSWRALPRLAGLNRCGKSCRLRWMNYLRPDIKRGNFSEEEERLIIHFHSIVGNKWAKIASHLPGRTDNEIKNYWNTHLRKRLLKEGIDPKTHKPIPTDHIPNDLLVNLIIAQSLRGPSNHNNNLGCSSSLSSNPWEQIIATELMKIHLVDNLIRLIGPKAPAVDCNATYSNTLLGPCNDTVNSAFQNINIRPGVPNPNPIDNLQQALNSWASSEQGNNLELPAMMWHYNSGSKECTEGSTPTGCSSLLTNASMDMFEDLDKLMVDDTCASFLKDFLE